LRRAADESGLARRLGLRLTEVGPGLARAELVITEDHLNFYGLTHGAVLFALADHVCSVAGNSLGRRAVMVQATSYLLANPDLGQRILAEGRVVRSGRSLGHLELEVHDDSGRLLCSVTAMIYFLDKEPV